MYQAQNVLVFDQTGWEQTIPLTHEFEESSPYPIKSLPAEISKAITAYHQYGKQPLPLISCSALAAVSLACQSLANVARDRVLISPISLYFIIVGSSGERKSSVDHVFSKGIKIWEQKIRNKLEPKIEISQALHHAWLAEKIGTLSQIRRSSLTGENVAQLKSHYLDILSQEPEVSLIPELFFEDITQEALVSHIAEGWPSASLWSDEGALILNGHGMQNNATKFVSFLNRIWDGKSFTAHRKTTKNQVVKNRRLTISLMIQPLVLSQMLAKGDGINRQSGFMARSLLTFPDSAMGERFYREPQKTQPALSSFHKIICECLDQSLTLGKDGCTKLPTLNFSNKAKIKWISFFDKIESELRDKWSTITDFASKAGENASRLSALLHLFLGKQGEISVEQTEQAIEIIDWHLLETRRIFFSRPKSGQHADAIKLLEWIKEKGVSSTTPRFIQQYSPIREKQRRDKAIQMLIDHNYLKEENTNSTTTLKIHPHLLSV